MAEKQAAPKKKPTAKKKPAAKKKPVTRKKAASKKAASKKAAPTKSVNKSKAIRDFSKENPKAGPTEIATELTKQGIDVTPAFVSTVKNIAKKSKRGRRKKAAAPAAAAAKPASDKIALSSLLSAKKLVEDVGGIDKARAALAALAKLQ